MINDPDFSSPNALNLKKSRNGLGLTAEQRKHLTPKQTGYYLEKRRLEFSSPQKLSKRIKKAQNAVSASWYQDIDFANPPDFPNHEYNYNPLGKLHSGMIEARKILLNIYLFRNTEVLRKNYGIMKES